MEKTNLLNKAILIAFVVALFTSSTYSVDVIDMRTPQIEDDSKLVEVVPQNKEFEVIPQNKELLLFNNYINTINSQEFAPIIATYYYNMVFTIDGYNLTLLFNESGIEKIIDGAVENPDLQMNISRENINYLINNWYYIDTFEKIKYIINLDGVPLGEVIKLSGIAMSLI
jgi:hypothetical protein